jgi:hypothetical protein
MTKPFKSLRDKLSRHAKAQANRLARGLLLVALPLGLAQAGERANYCHDPSVDADWKQLLSRHEGDPDFQYLYKLRQDLCADVDAGKLSLDEAIESFEAERERVVQDKQERLERLERLQGGTG